MVASDRGPGGGVANIIEPPHTRVVCLALPFSGRYFPTPACMACRANTDDDRAKRVKDGDNLAVFHFRHGPYPFYPWPVYSACQPSSYPMGMYAVRVVAKVKSISRQPSQPSSMRVFFFSLSSPPQLLSQVDE